MSFSATNSVKYEDIDAAEDSSYRYWRDVYLIVAWNDPQYDQLNIGDCVFALFENPDKTLTTIYFGAKIKQLNPLFIDYDEDGDHSNISIRPYTDIKTKAGNVRVPTVIRRMHAEHTPQHVEAIKKYVKRSRKHQADGDSEPKRKKRKIKKKKDDSKCCVCMEKKKEYAVQPCGHLCICGGCKEQIESATNSCPICRANADSYQKIYY